MRSARIILLLLLLGSVGVEAKGGAARASHPHTAKCTTCPRDAKGRILRNPAVVHEFERQTGYPHGRPGYVVDHIVPLCAGGTDAVSNMQWQSVADAKAKDMRERAMCE